MTSRQFLDRIIFWLAAPGVAILVYGLFVHYFTQNKFSIIFIMIIWLILIEILLHKYFGKLEQSIMKYLLIYLILIILDSISIYSFLFKMSN